MRHQCFSTLRLSAIFSSTEVQTGVVSPIFAKSALTAMTRTPVDKDPILPMSISFLDIFKPDSMNTRQCLDDSWLPMGWPIVPMSIVACLLITSGDSGVSFVISKLVKSCLDRWGCPEVTLGRGAASIFASLIMAIMKIQSHFHFSYEVESRKPRDMSSCKTIGKNDLGNSFNSFISRANQHNFVILIEKIPIQY